MRSNGAQQQQHETSKQRKKKPVESQVEILCLMFGSRSTRVFYVLSFFSHFFFSSLISASNRVTTTIASFYNYTIQRSTNIIHYNGSSRSAHQFGLQFARTQCRVDFMTTATIAYCLQFYHHHRARHYCACNRHFLIFLQCTQQQSNNNSRSSYIH